VDACPHVPLSLFLVGGGALGLLLVVGCQAPAKTSAKPNFGPPLTDVRTEAIIVQMENQYIADKNDQPTRQHEAEAKAAAKKKKAAEAGK